MGQWRYLTAAALLGCAPVQLSPGRGAMLITVVSAEIEPMKPNGDAWEPEEMGDDTALFGLLAIGTAALLGLPPVVGELAAGALAAAEAPPSLLPAPDPFVRLSLGSERFATSVHP